jgi:hypothetical protein
MRYMLRKTALILIFIALPAVLSFAGAAKSVSATAEASDLTDRVDFTLTADEQGASSVNSAGSSNEGAQEQTQVGKNAEKKAVKPAVPAAPVEPGVQYFEADLGSISRSLNEGGMDVNFRGGFGDYNNFGMQFIFDAYAVSKFQATEAEINFIMGFDWFPAGNAPASWYISPQIGIGMGLYNNLLEHPSKTISGMAMMPIGIQTGYRFNMGGFLLDTSVEYSQDYAFSGDFPNSPASNIFFRVGIGWFHDDHRPDIKDAAKKAEAKSEE